MATERGKEKGERTQLVTENGTANGAAASCVKGIVHYKESSGNWFCTAALIQWLLRVTLFIYLCER